MLKVVFVFLLILLIHISFWLSLIRLLVQKVDSRLVGGVEDYQCSVSLEILTWYHCKSSWEPLWEPRSTLRILNSICLPAKGRVPLPNRMNFWKNSKRPLTPIPPHFCKIVLHSCKEVWGADTVVWNACTCLLQSVSYFVFYRTRVRSLGMLVTD